MVGQSDLPFRTLVQRYGTTLAYTQMLKPDLILNDRDYLEFHIRDLTMNPSCPERPVVVQMCGNDPETVVQAGRKLQTYCDGIGMYTLGGNLACILIKLQRSESRMPAASGLGRSFWSLSSWPERLAIGRRNRYCLVIPNFVLASG
jgi:hypothetical protein